jgi:hypothetical protein
VKCRSSGALEGAGVRGELLMPGSPPWQCTPVNRRSKKVLKTAIFAIFRHPRRAGQVPRIASQIVPWEADPTRPGCSWTPRIPRGYRCTETATLISAPCSLSRATESVQLRAWRAVLADQMAVAKFSDLEYRMAEIEEQLDKRTAHTGQAR